VPKSMIPSLPRELSQFALALGRQRSDDGGEEEIQAEQEDKEQKRTLHRPEIYMEACLPPWLNAHSEMMTMSK
jgi:hypothetical protein